jgi:hypothetical protein
MAGCYLPAAQFVFWIRSPIAIAGKKEHGSGIERRECVVFPPAMKEVNAVAR